MCRKRNPLDTSFHSKLDNAIFKNEKMLSNQKYSKECYHDNEHFTGFLQTKNSDNWSKQ